MIEKGFISEVMNYESIRLGLTEEFFLTIIALEGSISTYRIFSSLRQAKNLATTTTKVSSMAYKNVHRRIKRLESIGLIEKVVGEKLLHKAIMYRLTSRGLFQCLLKSPTSAAVVVVDRDDRYKKNFILQTILYQFFEFETIKQFGWEPRLFILGKYLQGCSQAILSKGEEFRLSTFEGKEKWLADDMDSLIKNEIRKFVFEIMTNIKTKRVTVKWFDSDDNEYSRDKFDLDEKDDLKHRTVYPNSALARDKKFVKLVNEIKMEFDDGYEEFSSFSSSSSSYV